MKNSVHVVCCCAVLLVFAPASLVAEDDAEEINPFLPAINGDVSSPTNAVAHASPGPLSGFPGDPVTPSSPSASVSFPALGDPNTFVPPDTMGAAGISNVVTMLNTEVRIQDKLGN